MGSIEKSIIFCCIYRYGENIKRGNCVEYLKSRKLVNSWQFKKKERKLYDGCKACVRVERSWLNTSRLKRIEIKLREFA